MRRCVHKYENWFNGLRFSRDRTNRILIVINWSKWNSYLRISALINYTIIRARKLPLILSDTFYCKKRDGMNQSSVTEVSEEVSARPSWDTENFPITLPVAHCEKRFQERGNCFGCAPAVECPLVRPSLTGISSRSNCYSVTSELENTLYTR